MKSMHLVSRDSAANGESPAIKHFQKICADDTVQNPSCEQFVGTYGNAPTMADIVTAARCADFLDGSQRRNRRVTSADFYAAKYCSARSE